MTHHYHRKLQELGQLRNTIESLEALQDVIPNWARERAKIRIEEHKLLYRELIGHQYKSYKELREAIDGN